MIHYLCAMARIIGIDYGTKRIGIATTDPLQIIASPLETVATQQIFDYLTQYFFTEEVERIIVGEPKKLDDTDGDILPEVRRFVEKLNQLFPNIPVDMQDERYTSREAQRIIINSIFSFYTFLESKSFPDQNWWACRNIAA